MLLATGCRERPRAARLVPGDRPAGVMTTGELQQRVYLGGERLAGRALVVGAEHVSLLRRGDARARRRRWSRWSPSMSGSRATPCSGSARRCAGGCRCGPGPRSAVVAGRRTAGRGRGGRTSAPARRGSCRATRWSSPATGSPTTSWPGWPGWPWIPAPADRWSTRALETSAPGVFAAGNLVHAAETADIAALSGRHAAPARIAAALGAGGPDAAGAGGGWPGAGRAAGRVPVRVEAPLRWISPNAIDASLLPPRWAGSCCAAGSSAGRPGLRSGRMAGCWPGHAWPGWCRGGRVHLGAAWLARVDPAGGPVRVTTGSRPGWARVTLLSGFGFAGGAGDDRTGRPQDGRGGARGQLRASQADREGVIDALKAAYVAGRLTEEEFEARVGQAFASRTRADLAAITADIPAGPVAALPPGCRTGWSPGAPLRSSRPPPSAARCSSAVPR